MTFRVYHYATIYIVFVWQDVIYTIYLDIKCIISLIDREFLDEFELAHFIKKSQTSIIVREVNIKRYFTNDYLLLDIYIENEIDEQKRIAHIKRKTHVIDNLKIKILVKINIIASKRIIVNVDAYKLIINSY